MVHFRQPQIRWTWATTDRLRLALALEDPDVELTGATAANQFARSRVAPSMGASAWRTPAGGGPVPRNPRVSIQHPADIVGASGWGVTGSGQLPSPIGSRHDRVLFQVTSGAGISRYVTDLNSAGRQDGVYDATTNTIRALSASAGFGSYEHYWSDRIHSAFTAGVVQISTLDIQPTSALRRTTRYSGNIIWEPVPRLELVAEFLYGTRVNRDAQSARARQLQIGSTFRF